MSEIIMVGRNLSTHFHVDGRMVRALDSIDSEITSALLTVIIGASASGKSTLPYALSDLHTPENGTSLIICQNPVISLHTNSRLGLRTGRLSTIN